MYNPLNTLRKIQSRMGKPIRPVVEVQKNGSVVNIVTNAIQTDNMINDTFRSDAWEVHPEDKSFALYIDGVFKGMSYWAGEEGAILSLTKSVKEQRVIKDKDGNEKTIDVENLCLSYKGIFGKWLDASLIERGSALKPSLTQTMIYCVLVGIACFLMGMVY